MIPGEPTITVWPAETDGPDTQESRPQVGRLGLPIDNDGLAPTRSLMVLPVRLPGPCPVRAEGDRNH